jgi:hypothetical protein
MEVLLALDTGQGNAECGKETECFTGKHTLPLFLCMLTAQALSDCGFLEVV